VDLDFLQAAVDINGFVEARFGFVELVATPEGVAACFQTAGELTLEVEAPLLEDEPAVTGDRPFEIESGVAVALLAVS
jgi:hypothetical protein